MNIPSEEELNALFEQGGIEAIAQHAGAAADADFEQILKDAFNAIPPDEPC